MKQSRSFLWICGILIVSSFLLPEGTRAQQGPGGLGGYTGNIESNINNTSITIQVKAPDGSKLNRMAIVNLTNLLGQLVGSQTTFGSQTVFQVPPGGYTVEVDAFGFEKAQVKTEVSNALRNRVVTISLKPDSANGLSYVPGAAVALSPKAQKQVSKGVQSLQANKFDEAIRYLESAHQLAPTQPDVTYMIGTVYEKKNDMDSARKYWDEALKEEPSHISSLLSCGDMLLRRGDVAGARKYLDKAVEVAPNSWRAHSLLATALLQQNSYADAVTNAERAVELGKGAANSSYLILGQALAREGQNKPAIEALEEYLNSNPPQSQAQAVQQLITQIKALPSAPDAATVGGVTASVGSGSIVDSTADAAMTLTPAMLHWLPANVDSAVPPVEPGVACALDTVLKNVSAKVQQLPSLVDRYSATEVLHHEDVSDGGYADHVEDLSFNYLASIREIKNRFGEFLDVEEYRNGSMGDDMFPDKMASTGLPSIVLIFHPWLASDFDFKCEGLSRQSSGFAWQVYFSQKKDKPSRIRQYRVGAHVYPIALKGRAWIDADTFQVVRLETDLREPRPDLKLATEHLIMQYGPVHFKVRKEVLWLPSSAEYYAIFRGHRLHRRHTFTNYILFSVEDQQKIGEPPKTAADVAVEKKSSE